MIKVVLVTDEQVLMTEEADLQYLEFGIKFWELNTTSHTRSIRIPWHQIRKIVTDRDQNDDN
jgi:hypothetical protein